MANVRALIGRFRRRLRRGRSGAEISREIREARRKAKADAAQHDVFGQDRGSFGG
jgi:hypothetical protein